MKKMLSVLLSLVLCLGMFPPAALALEGDVPNNPAGTTLEVLNQGEMMQNNYGTIKTNSGTVYNNDAAGIIENNTGSIWSNYGIVYNNSGTVGENLNSTGASGSGLTPGRVYNIDGGTITGGYYNTGTDYYLIKLAEGTSHVTLAAESSGLEGDKKQYITDNSTATLTADEGYVIQSAAAGGIEGTVAAGGKTCTFTFGAVSEVTAVSAMVERASAEALVAKVTTDSGEISFASLQDAVDSVGAGGTATITLLDNVALESTLEIPASAQFALDLAGHQITCGSNTAMGVAGTVTIQDSSTDKSGKVISTVGIAIAVPGTLTLEGGTFEGSRAAIMLGPQSANITVANLLGTGYAYYQGSSPIPLSSLGTDSLSGPVTVKKCDHKGAAATNNGGGKHTLACPYCGHTGTAENCAYAFSGNEGTCSACKDKVTVTVSGTEGLVYDGSAKTPAVTVKRGETVLTVGTDYTVVYENNTNAGTAKVNVTIGQNQGTYTKNFTIQAPQGTKKLTVVKVTGSKTYDGSNQVPVSSITLEGVVSGDDVSIDTSGLKATAGSANAGTYSTVTLPQLTLTGADAAKYTLAQPSGAVSASVEIAKAGALTPETGDLAVSNKQAREYTFGLGALRPTLEDGRSFGSTAVTYTLGAVSLGDYYTGGAEIEGQTLTLPINDVQQEGEKTVGSVTVTIHTQNFADMTATINVRSVDKIIPEGGPVLSANTLTYGQPLSAITLSGAMKDGDTDVPGVFAWGQPTNVFASVGTYTAAWRFTPADNGKYAVVNGTSEIQVAPASIAGAEVSLWNRIFIKTPQSLDDFGYITVSLNGNPLAEGVDYDLAIGDSQVTASGKGNYTGTAGGDFEVARLGEAVPVTGMDGSDVSLYLQVSTLLEALPSTPPDFSVETIEEKLTEAVGSGYTLALMNVRLVDQSGNPAFYDGAATGSITVTLPYPSGITEQTAGGYDFTVRHMKHDGTIESCEPQPTSNGLRCTFSGLSPVAVGYKAKSGGDKPDDKPGGGSGGGGGGVSYYSVKVEDSEHGEVTASPSSIYSGGTVTLTAAPEKGYRLKALTAVSAQGKTLELTEKDGGYTFRMPGSNVTVTAEFEPDAAATPGPTSTPVPTSTPGPTASPSPEPWKNPYPDVKEGDWFYQAVEFVSRQGLMAGYQSGRFGPNDTLTRAQFAQIIYNMEGRPEASGGRFADVEDGRWYADAVNWAAERGIVTGTGGGNFSPDQPVTRQDLAVMLWRWAGSPEPEEDGLDFADAKKVSGYAWKAVCWASGNGIVDGKGGGILDPRGTAKRSEAAQMLMRYLGK